MKTITRTHNPDPAARHEHAAENSSPNESEEIGQELQRLEQAEQARQARVRNEELARLRQLQIYD